VYDGYRTLASVYDRLNGDIDYVGWSGFLEACFDRYLPARPRLVLDLACGTGRMTFPLADRGYDMIGIDGSEDMLAEAYRKSTDRTIAILDRTGQEELPDGVTSPLFLQQDMRSFELYGTVDAAVCCLDSMNYLCGEGDLDACLSCLYLYLAPGGLLIFDVNSPWKFAHTYGSNAYILEASGEDSAEEAGTGPAIFCGWQNQYDPATRLCHFYLSLFTEGADGRYTRSDEEQTERCYTEAELREALDRAGFEVCGLFGDTDFHAPTPETERWHLVARTRKTGDWYLNADRACASAPEVSHP
jgi:SAM-dependent methyltransferase